MPRVPWVERRFSFDFPADLYPALLERLRGTPVRAEAIARSLPPEILVRRDGDRWSIQENIAHVADLDRETFHPRLDQYDGGVEVLRPADMTNRHTEDARHNARPIDDVLAEFFAVRGRIVARLEEKPPES